MFSSPSSSIDSDLYTQAARAVRRTSAKKQLEREESCREKYDDHDDDKIEHNAVPITIPCLSRAEPIIQNIYYQLQCNAMHDPPAIPQRTRLTRTTDPTNCSNAGTQGGYKKNSPDGQTSQWR